MVLVGEPGLYYFQGVIVDVPESGEVDVEDKVAEAMKIAGFKVKRGRPASEDSDPLHKPEQQRLAGASSPTRKVDSP